MALFHYRAYTAQGDYVDGDIDAATREAAEESIWARGLTPFETRAAQPSAKGGRSRLKPADIAGFTREFAMLAEADVPLDRSLTILAEQAPNAARRALAENVLRRLLDGATLSDTLAEASPAFDQGYVSVVRAGEAMGKVGAALAQLAEMLERRLESRAKLQTALIYPCILIVLALASTGIVVGVLAPAVSPIFSESGKPMPGGLQFVIDLEEQWPVFLGIGVIGTIGFAWLRALAKRRPEIRSAIDRAWLDAPIIGKWMAQHAAGQFTRTLGALLNAGVPLISGLQSAAQSVGNAFLREQLAGTIDFVSNGGSLSRGLAQIPKIPASAPQLVAVGEEAGHLGPILLRVAAMYERATERAVERAMGMLTPALTVLIATLVGGLVLTVMNAVLSINDLATQ